MNKKDFRIQNIIRELAQDPQISVDRLAQKFKVSGMTIRRDIRYIEENNLLDTSGFNKIGNEYEYKLEESKNAELKKKIALAAVSMIQAQDVIVLDSGTTAGFIAAAIPEDMPITVICYSFQILSQLYNRENVNLILAGGYYHHNIQSFESPENVQFLKKFRAQKMFVCASGIHETLGLTCADQRIAANKMASISTASQRILVADSSKFGNIGPGYFSPIEQMDLVITDQGIPEIWKKILKEKEVPVQIV